MAHRVDERFGQVLTTAVDGECSKAESFNKLLLRIRGMPVNATV
jgi:hypothetical protein